MRCLLILGQSYKLKIKRNVNGVANYFYLLDNECYVLNRCFIVEAS